MPTACPSLDQLEQLLRETLAEAEQTAMLQHLDACAECRQRLETLAGGTEDWFKQAAQGPAPASSRLAQMIEHLKAAETRRLGDSPADQALSNFDDYELLEEIARGGMGVVYRARQISLDRIVAVKMILWGQFATKDDVLRFRAEAEASARLQHSNIVRIHETGEVHGQPYFSMDYVEGGNLAVLVREKPLPAKRAAGYLKPIAEAIHYAHEQGVLHRDLKPSNVLIDSSDQPRVTDFGLAKRMQKESFLTVTGDILGSPNFMPPEQAGAKAVKAGRYSDVYALGGILFYLVTGRPPFVAENVAETLHHVLHTEPVSPRLLNPSVPQDIATLCLKCLEKDPARRYQTAKELAEELGRVLNDEPIRARPVSLPEKLGRWCRRHPTVAGLAATVVLSLTLGFAGILWQWQEADVARREAEAISTFLIGVFQSPDPARDGRLITVAETLDKAVKKIEIDRTIQPERRAKLQAALGDTYHALGLDREAIPLQEKVRDYYRAASGPEHPDTLKAMQRLALSFHYAGRREDALKLHEEVMRLRRSVSGPEHPETIEVMGNLAMSYFHAGRRDEALQLREQVLTLRRKVSGPEHPDTLSAINRLAISYHFAGRRSEALQMFEELLPLRRKVLGSEHPDALEAMFSVANSYDETGRRNEALAMYERILPLQRKVLGSPHPATEMTITRLMRSYHDAGRGDEALKLEEELLLLKLTNARKSSTNNPVELESLLAALAELRYRQKQYASAELLYREQLESRRRRPGAEQSEIGISATASLGRLLSDWAWAERSTNVSSGFQHAREGETLLRDALAARMRLTNSPAWRMADLQSRLGGALGIIALTDPALTAAMRESKLVESQAFLQQGYESLEQDPNSKKSKYKRDAIERFVHLYEAWNEFAPDTPRAAQSAAWKQKLAEFDQTTTNTKPAGTEP